MHTPDALNAKLLLLLIAVYLGFALFALVPGYVLNDEAIYHLIVKSIPQSGGLYLWNGYQDFPSPELIPIFTTTHNGRLTPQYPYLYPLIGFFAHAAGGYRGMIWLNLLAFPTIMSLCYLIALRIFHDSTVARLAAGIYACATFSFEYAFAALPHLLTICLLLLACYLFLNAFTNTTAPKSSALLCGFLVGLAMGIRLDAVFVLPCVMLPFLMIRPQQLHNMLLVGAGALPGMLLLSVTNRLKFDSWSILSYGYSGAMLSRYWPFGILGGAAALGLWALTRPSVRRRAARYRKIACVGSIILVSGLLLKPDVRHDIGKRWNAFSQILVDFRLRETVHAEEVSTISPERGMWLDDMQGLKKSLLQSCPYLICLLVPALHIVRKRHDQEDRWKLLWLFSIPLVYAGFYGYYGWHGGHSLNLRYLLPIFPFTSILTAYSWRLLVQEDSRFSDSLRNFATAAQGHKGKNRQEISVPDLSKNFPPGPLSFKERGSKSSRWHGRLFSPSLAKRGGRGGSFRTGASKSTSTVLNSIYNLDDSKETSNEPNHQARFRRSYSGGQGVLIPMLGILGVFILFAIFSRLLSSQEQQEIVYLTCPLVLAGLTAFLFCASRFFPFLWSARALRVLMIVMLCWAGFVEFGYDYVRARRVRQRTLNIAEQAAAAITEPAIIFTSEPFPFWRLVERERVWVANPEQDNWADFRQLLNVHLTQGHAAYGAFPPEEWGRLRQSGLLEPNKYTIRPLGYFSGIFCQISPRSSEETLP